MNRDNDAFSAEFEQTPTIVISDQEEQWPSTWSETQQEEKSQEPEKRAPVNVFDYEVSDFEVETKPNQEMQQRGISGLLSNGTSHAPDNSQDESQWMEVDTPGTNAHIEHA